MTVGVPIQEQAAMIVPVVRSISLSNPDISELTGVDPLFEPGLAKLMSIDLSLQRAKETGNHFRIWSY